MRFGAAGGRGDGSLRGFGLGLVLFALGLSGENIPAPRTLRLRFAGGEVTPGGRSPGRLEVAEGDERASEVREARDTGLVAAERVEEVEGDQEPDEPLCLDREDAPDVDRVVRPVDGECDHEAVDRAGGTRDRVWEEDGEE